MNQSPNPECTEQTACTPDGHRLLLNRLSRIEGQIRGLRGMIERDCDCLDILTQSSAAGAALDAFNRELLGCHLRGRLDGDVVDELLIALQKLMK